MREPLLRSDPSPQYRDTALKILAGWKTLGHDISRKLWVLKSSSLCAEARRRTRLEDFGDPPIEPALTILVNSLETEADPSPSRRSGCQARHLFPRAGGRSTVSTERSPGLSMENKSRSGLGRRYAFPEALFTGSITMEAEM